MNHKLEAGIALGLGLAFAAMTGIGLASYAAEPEALAREARLIGYCQGRVMAGLEESSFPANCDWIEAIRLDDGGPRYQAEHGRALRLESSN